MLASKERQLALDDHGRGKPTNNEVFVFRSFNKCSDRKQNKTKEVRKAKGTVKLPAENTKAIKGYKFT